MSQSTLISITGYTPAFRTDIGNQRSHNEDAGAILALPPESGVAAAFVLCDGMGGLQAGEKASGEAVRVVSETLTDKFGGAAENVPVGTEAIHAVLRDALVRANDAVNGLHPRAAAPSADPPTESGDSNGGGGRRRSETAPPSALMGTTCVAGVVVGDTLHVAHAGDSRAYLWRGGNLIRLTDDHSYVAERVKAGDITEAEARVSRFRNVITRAIGIEPTVNPDVRAEPLQPGDLVMVCSDGLTTELLDDEISQLLRSPALQKATPERAAALLVDAANKKGGHDNITVYLLRAEGTAPASAAKPALSADDTGGVVDLDAPRTHRRRSSPAGSAKRGTGTPLIAALGILLAIAALAAGYFFVQWQQAKKAANPLSLTPSGITSSPLLPDYGRLVYAAPQPFTTLGARGDLLAFSRDGGLFFVRVQSGTITSVGDDGTPRHADAGTVEVPAPLREVPSTQMFLATDGQGNLYLSFTRRRIIEKRSPEGKVLQTLRGFDRPEAVAVNDAGDLFVIDDNQIKVLRAHLPSAAVPAPKPAPKATASAGKPGK